MRYPASARVWRMYVADFMPLTPTVGSTSALTARSQFGVQRRATAGSGSCLAFPLFIRSLGSHTIGSPICSMLGIVGRDIGRAARLGRPATRELPGCRLTGFGGNLNKTPMQGGKLMDIVPLGPGFAAEL